VRADSRVDEYIGRLPDWQQAVCQQVRRLVHTADPEVEETIKRSVRPYFVLQGSVGCRLTSGNPAQESIHALALSGGCPGRRLLRACHGVHPPFPRHALQFLHAVIVEDDSGTGNQVFYRLRYEHLARCRQRGHARTN